MKRKTTQPKCALDDAIKRVLDDENSPIGLAIADYITKHLKLDKEEMDGIPYITLSWETKDKHKPIDCIAII